MTANGVFKPTSGSNFYFIDACSEAIVYDDDDYEDEEDYDEEDYDEEYDEGHGEGHDEGHDDEGDLDRYNNDGCNVIYEFDIDSIELNKEEKKSQLEWFKKYWSMFNEYALRAT